MTFKEFYYNILVTKYLGVKMGDLANDVKAEIELFARLEAHEINQNYKTKILDPKKTTELIIKFFEKAYIEKKFSYFLTCHLARSEYSYFVYCLVSEVDEEFRELLIKDIKHLYKIEELNREKTLEYISDCIEATRPKSNDGF